MVHSPIQPGAIVTTSVSQGEWFLPKFGAYADKAVQWHAYRVVGEPVMHALDTSCLHCGSIRKVQEQCACVPSASLHPALEDNELLFATPVDHQ